MKRERERDWQTGGGGRGGEGKVSKRKKRVGDPNGMNIEPNLGDYRAFFSTRPPEYVFQFLKLLEKAA